MSKKEKLIDILFNKSNSITGVISLIFNYISNILTKFFYPIPNYSFISGLKEKLSYSPKTKIVYSLL